MTDKDPAQASDDIARQMTSAFRTEFLNEPDTPSATADEYAMSRAQGAPTKDTAFPEIKRGPPTRSGRPPSTRDPHPATGTEVAADPDRLAEIAVDVMIESTRKIQLRPS